MTPAIECFHHGADRLGECPIWSVAEQALYWVDSRGPAIHRIAPAEGVRRSRPLERVVGSIAFRAGGGLIAAMAHGVHAVDFNSGDVALLADPETHMPDNRFNDGRCDRLGRFWAGTMSDVSRDPTGALYRMTADHRMTRMSDGIIVPNSIAWSPDDKTMYFADTYRARIVAYSFSLAEGAISAPRLFADTAGRKGRPDGSAVDETGCLWNAEYGGGRLVRYRPDGRIDATIALPVSQPSCCCFGGADLGILFVTSATQRLTPDQLAAQPLAGAVLAINAGVKGLPETAFAG
jgi:sugar lactone lactonase YvrE